MGEEGAAGQEWPVRFLALVIVGVVVAPMARRWIVRWTLLRRCPWVELHAVLRVIARVIALEERVGVRSGQAVRELDKRTSDPLEE